MDNILIKSVSKEEFTKMLDTLPEDISVASTVLIDNFKERIYEMECNDIEEEFVGAFYNSDLVGLIWFPEDDELIVETEEECNPTFISDILVHPKYQGNGIGKKLVEHAIKHSASNILFTTPFDLNADDFFRSIGFRKKVMDDNFDNIWIFNKNKG